MDQFRKQLKRKRREKNKKQKKELGEREPWDGGTRVNLPF